MHLGGMTVSYERAVTQLVEQLTPRLSDAALELIEFTVGCGKYQFAIRDLVRVLVRDAIPVSRPEFDLLTCLLEWACREATPPLEALTRDDGDLVVVAVREWLMELVEPLYFSLYPRLPEEARRCPHSAWVGGEWGYLLEDLVYQVDQHHVPVTPEECESLREAMSHMPWKFANYPPAETKWNVTFVPELSITDAQRLRATVLRIADAVLNQLPGPVRRQIIPSLIQGRWPHTEAFIGMVDAAAKHRVPVTVDVVADARWIIDHLGPKYPTIAAKTNTVEKWVINPEPNGKPTTRIRTT